MAGHTALVERDGSLGTAEAALRGLAAEPALVVVEAEAGLGKTALLQELRRRVAGSVRVLAARPAEHEADYALGVVRQLFAAAVARLDPGERERLAAGPAGPGLAALADAPAGMPLDGFGVADGLHWLAAELAAREPLVLLVDDAHWADPASLRVLGHLARRLDGLALGLVVAMRPDEPGTPADLLDALRLDPRADVIALRALTPAGVTGLVGGDQALGAACHRATGGNPLYLRELLRTVTRAAEVEDASPATIARHVTRRVATLGPAAVALAEAMALTGDGTPLAHAAAVADMPAAEARSIAERLRSIAVLGGTDPVRFAHPVVLAAVRGALAPERRDALLRRAVAVLVDADAPAEQLAGYLLALPPGSGADLAPLLRAAEAALARGAPDSARTYLRRALAEPPGAAQRPAVLHALATAEQALADPAYAGHLRAAVEAAPDDGLRVMWTVQLAGALAFEGRVADGLKTLEDALDAPWVPDGDARDLLRAYTLALSWGSADGSVRAPGILAHFDARPPRVPATARFVAGMRAGRMDRPADEVVALAEAAHHDAPDPRAFLGRIMAAGALLYADRYDQSRERLELLLDQSRAIGIRSDISAVHVMLAELAYTRGDLEEAATHADAGAVPFDAGPPTGTHAYVAAVRIRVALERGRLEDAEALLAGVGPEPWSATSHAQYFLRVAQGRVRFAQGRYVEAAAAFAAGRRCLARFAQTVWSPIGFDGGWEEPLALLAGGRAQEARTLVEDGLNRLAPSPPRNQALTLRTAANLATAGHPVRVDAVPAGDGGAVLAAGPEAQLEAAADLLEGVGARLELARTLMELGRLRRRTGARAAAREPLSRAMDLARDCGAAPLAATAREELAATGARPRRDRLTSGRDALTPSEARLARLAAAGRTNREIAQELYLSQKTVEMHLGRAYRKLGVQGRAELAAALEAPE